jgi:hypothetical protein
MDEFNNLFPAKGSKKIALVAALRTLIEKEKDARSRTDFAGL